MDRTISAIQEDMDSLEFLIQGTSEPVRKAFLESRMRDLEAEVYALTRDNS